MNKEANDRFLQSITDFYDQNPNAKRQAIWIYRNLPEVFQRDGFAGFTKRSILYEGIRPFDVLIGPILFQEADRQKAARDIEHPDAFLKVENPSICPEYPEDVWNVNKSKFQRSVKYLIYKEIK